MNVSNLIMSFTKCYFYFFITIFICLCDFNCEAQLFEGDTCQGNENGVEYKCKRIYDCKSAFEMIRSDERPSLCGYQESVPIVCCKQNNNQNNPSSGSSEETGSPVPTSVRPTTIENNVKNPNNGLKSISERKCEEYATHVFQKPAHAGAVIEDDYDDEVGVNNPTSSSLNGKKSTCGKREEPLIVNGTAVSPREFPHQANLGYRYGNHYKWICTGSLISERYILSAAHCSNTYYGPPRVAVVGDLDTESTRDDARPVQLRIVAVIDHPGYSTERPYNDISLYKLEKNVIFDGYKRPACLNNIRHIKETQAIATGWGDIKTKGPSSSYLLKVRLSLIPHSTCKQYWSTGGSLKRGIDDDSMLCAGDLKGNKDTCQGDSGGPLQNPLVKPFCMYSIIGVTSFGKACGIKIPGIYTRVSHYVPWIESIVWPNE